MVEDTFYQAPSLLEPSSAVVTERGYGPVARLGEKVALQSISTIYSPCDMPHFGGNQTFQISSYQFARVGKSETKIRFDAYSGSDPKQGS